MARPKGTKKAKTVTDDRFQVQEVKTPFCLNCGTNGKVNSFYISNNATHIHNSCRLPYCKECLETFYQEYYKKTGRSDLAIFYLCRKCDVFFSTKVFEGAERIYFRRARSKNRRAKKHCSQMGDRIDCQYGPR